MRRAGRLPLRRLHALRGHAVAAGRLGAVDRVGRDPAQREPARPPGLQHAGGAAVRLVRAAPALRRGDGAGHGHDRHLRLGDGVLAAPPGPHGLGAVLVRVAAGRLVDRARRGDRRGPRLPDGHLLVGGALRIDGGRHRGRGPDRRDRPRVDADHLRHRDGGRRGGLVRDVARSPNALDDGRRTVGGGRGRTGGAAPDPARPQAADGRPGRARGHAGVLGTADGVAGLLPGRALRRRNRPGGAGRGRGHVHRHRAGHPLRD